MKIDESLPSGSRCGLLALLTLGVVVAGSGAHAQIDYIGDLGLYNTGVDDSGNILPSASIDPHYVATVSADPVNPAPPDAPARNWGILPVPPWVANDAPNTNSNWISAGNGIIFDPPDTTNGQSDTVGGTFVYETSFDLGTLDPSTTELVGRWLADDTGIAILVNGSDAGVTHGSPSFGSWDGFRISSGLVAGANTVSFEVLNGGDARSPNPHGLRVEWGVVPEPTSLALFAAGSFACVAGRRRRQG